VSWEYLPGCSYVCENVERLLKPGIRIYDKQERIGIVDKAVSRTLESFGGFKEL